MPDFYESFRYISLFINYSIQVVSNTQNTWWNINILAIFENACLNLAAKWQMNCWASKYPRKKKVKFGLSHKIYVLTNCYVVTIFKLSKLNYCYSLAKAEWLFVYAWTEKKTNKQNS